MAPHKSPSCNQSAATKQGAQRPKDSETYKKRRERNNIAVRKSRQLTREKAKQTDEKVRALRQENEALAEKVQLLNKELSVLRDLFLSSAPSSAPSSTQPESSRPTVVFKEEG